MDSDGDVDVLSASYLDYKIAWYENNGNEIFTPHTITTSAQGAQSVFAIDLDKDGDVDVLSASQIDNKIAWYENNNNVFTPHTITTSADGASSVFAIDLDKDGDIDVLSASTYDNKIAWYENNGNEIFTSHTITTSANGASSVFAIDLDKDGDVDVLSANSDGNTIAWYENNGNEIFTPHTITTSANWASSVFAIDLDDDGDIDVLSSSFGGDTITWYENIMQTSTCNNGIKDGDEIGVDCSGSCPPCVSCDNRIKDGNETGVDCGAVCNQSCYRLKILAMAIDWRGTKESYNQTVNEYLDYFIDETPLKYCPQKVLKNIISIDQININNPIDRFLVCQAPFTLKTIAERYSLRPDEYDVIAGFCDYDFCDGDGVTTFDSFWVETVWGRTHIAAHEIGHVFELEDEYCSNPAGSWDRKCNDAGIDGVWNLWGLLGNDINYLDANLDCNASEGGGCCETYGFDDCSGYDICCIGNRNSKDGTSIMSFTDAEDRELFWNRNGPRSFDNHSLAHLASFKTLQCEDSFQPTILLAGSSADDKIVDISLRLYSNLTVEKEWIKLFDGESEEFILAEDFINLTVEDENGAVLWNKYFDAYWGYRGAVFFGKDYSNISYDYISIGAKAPYDTRMEKLSLYFNGTKIYEEDLSFCNQDGICNGAETYLSCWYDCKSYSQDGLCLNYSGDGCDPDCAKGVDPDCDKKSINISLTKGWNLISIPLILENNSVDNVFESINYSGLFSYDSGWKVPTEINNTMGLWINMLNDDTLIVNGIIPNNTIFNLKQGYNLIGYPSLNESNVSFVFNEINVTTVFSYENSTWKSYNPKKPDYLNTLKEMKPGYGYLIYSNENTTTIIP